MVVINWSDVRVQNRRIFHSAVVLSWAIRDCFCGAPFDLEATPNYKARIKEAGFPWPPPKRIDYPTKTW